VLEDIRSRDVRYSMRYNWMGESERREENSESVDWERIYQNAIWDWRAQIWSQKKSEDERMTKIAMEAKASSI